MEQVHVRGLVHERLLFSTSFPEDKVYNLDWNDYYYFDLSLTIVGAQPNVNMKPEAQSPEFLWYFNSVLRILLISFIKDSSHA